MFGCSNGRSAYASVLVTTNKVRRRTAVGAPILSWILYARDLHYYNIEHFAFGSRLGNIVDETRSDSRTAKIDVKWPHAYKPSVGMFYLQCSVLQTSDRHPPSVHAAFIFRTMLHRPHVAPSTMLTAKSIFSHPCSHQHHLSAQGASYTSFTYLFLSARVKTPEIREPCYQKDSHGH